MGKPAIPPYGRHFRHERLDYDRTREFAARRYALKTDPRWDVISDPSSEHWRVRLNHVPVSRPQDTFRDAMALLLDGITSGHYDHALIVPG